MTAEQVQLLSNYDFKTNRKIDKTTRTGTLELININKDIVYTTDASVRKIWSGGDEATHVDVPVKLIQTTSQLSSTQLAAADAANYPPIQNGQQSIAVNLVNGSGSSIFTVSSEKELASENAVTVSPSGFVSVISDTSNAKKLTVSGNTAGTGIITVKFADDSEQKINVVVLSQTATLTTAKLTQTWQGLPLKDADGNQYYYYVLETQNFENYLTSYTASGSQTIITNTSTLFDLRIMKDWNGTESQHSSDTVTVVLHRSTTPQTSEVPLISDSPVVTYELSLEIDNNEISTGGTALLIPTLNPSGSLDGLVYNVFSDAACTQSSTLVTVASDGTVTAGSTAGTFYIKATISSLNVESEAVALTVSQNTEPDNEVITMYNDMPYYPGDLNIDDSFTVTLKGPAFAKVSLQLCGNIDGNWNSGHSAGDNIYFDENGNCTITVISQMNFKSTQLQVWNVEGHSNSDVKYVTTITSEYIKNLSELDDTAYFTNGFQYAIKTSSPIASIENVNNSENISVNSTEKGWWVKIKYTPNASYFTLLVTGANLDWGESIKVTLENGYTKNISIKSPAKTQNAPPRRYRKPFTVTPSSTTTNAAISTQQIYRMGKLMMAEKVVEQNDDIETINQAITLFIKPKIILKSANTGNAWITDDNGGEHMMITLSAQDTDWTKIKTLPMYNDAGSKYYYWAEETVVTGNSSLSAFDVAYKFDDGTNDTIYCIDAMLHGNSEITIRNTLKDTPTEGILPESGGSGTKSYYTIGELLLLLSAAGYVTIKCRRWLHE